MLQLQTYLLTLLFQFLEERLLTPHIFEKNLTIQIVTMTQIVI